MKKALTIITLLLSVSGSLQATMVSFTNTVAMRSLQDATVSLSKFNSSLGTLTGIHIEFTTALYGTDYQFDNDIEGGRSKTVTVTLTSDTTGYFSTAVRLTGTGIYADGRDLLISAFGSLTLAPNDGDPLLFDIGGADYGQWAPGTLSATTGGDVDSSVFADYIGSGNFTATVNSEILAKLSTLTDIAPGPNKLPSGTFSATVTYNYAAVPEPAAIGLISLGGILTLTISRIRRRK